MKREEEIKNAAYQYGVLHAKYEMYQEDPSFIAGAEWADAHNPEIAYLEHEIERLKSKLQAADDLNTLLTAELEKVGCSSK